MSKTHTQEHQDNNKKSIKVGDEEKLLLFDDDGSDENSSPITETDLQKIVEHLIAQVFEGTAK